MGINGANLPFAAPADLAQTLGLCSKAIEVLDRSIASILELREALLDVRH
jgi:hypothetical protein